MHRHAWHGTFPLNSLPSQRLRQRRCLLLKLGTFKQPVCWSPHFMRTVRNKNRFGLQAATLAKSATVTSPAANGPVSLSLHIPRLKPRALTKSLHIVEDGRHLSLLAGVAVRMKPL